ncbi:MAG: cation:dicarboxylase symporter family transporter [Candidatus Zixiibacteriota bacterium]
MNSKSSTSLLIATVLAVILGGFIGYYFPEVMLSISFVGQLFLNALRLVVIPLVIAAVIVGVAAMADVGRVSRTVGKTLLYFAVTSAIAVLIGLGLVTLIQPGAGVSADSAVIPPEVLSVTSFSISQLLGSIIPSNLFAAGAVGNLLGLIIFAVFFGVVLIPMGDRGKVIIDFLRAVNQAIMKIVTMLIWVAPLGVLSLVGTAVAENALSMDSMLGSLGLYSLTLAIAFLIHAAVILPLALRFFAQRPVMEYLSNMAPALTTALGTGSAAAALPITYDSVVDKSEIDDRAGSITVPLGAMVNMNGTALYLIIAALFSAQIFQVELSILQVLIVVGTSFVISFGASLMPNASAMLLAVVMYAAGFPAQAYAGIGIVLIMDWFFDRWRAVVDVWGDAVGAAVIGETFDFKTARHIRQESPDRKAQRGPRRPDRPQRDARQKPPASQQQDKAPLRQERKGQERTGHQRDADRRSRGEDRDRDKSRRGDHRSKHKERQPRAERPENRQQPPRQQQKTREERASTFVMPPVPYHVLENELRPRKREQEPKDTTAEVKANGDAGRTSADVDTTLSSQTIERERAKIAAQLAELRQNETSNTGVTDTEEIVVESDDTQRVEVSSSERPQTQADFPKIDFYAGDDKPIPPDRGESTEEIPAPPESYENESPADTIEEPYETPVENQIEQETRPQSFGRGKARRTPPTKSEPKSEQEQTSREPEKPEFSSENISFGRSKRKKPSA